MKSINDFIIDIYFDEIESRERVVSRIQINIGIFAGIGAILSYMARRLDYSSNIALIIMFWIGEFSSIVLVSISVYLTMYALTGYDYKSFPKAREVIKYKRDIELYKKNGVEVDDSVEDFMIDNICECIDNNYTMNELRRKSISRSIYFLFLSLIPILFSVSIFVLFDMDVSSPRKNMLIEDRAVAEKLDEFVSLAKNGLAQNYLKGGKKMGEEQSQNNQGGTGTRGGHGNQSAPAPAPAPAPQLPPLVRPKIQISTENFQGDKGKDLLNE